MNYLAHFHLASRAGTASDRQALIVGALLGDFVKGPLRGDWPADWERGIALHRRIDALTDSHDEVIALLETLPPGYRRYGGIMLDVCFDYCLSRHWRHFHDTELSEFTQQVYRVLAGVEAQLPAPARRQAQRLRRYDVLCQMGNWQTVDGMLTRIGQRLRRANPLDASAAVLQQHLPAVEQRFMRLYPQLLDSLSNTTH